MSAGIPIVRAMVARDAAEPAHVRWEDQGRLISADGGRDPRWERFLGEHPCGQYQQSGRWAEFKAADGWQARRLVLENSSGSIVGGFQLLWRMVRGLRIGYVSKGPIAPLGDGAVAGSVAEALVGEARRLRLLAVVVQEPDESGEAVSSFLARRALTENPTQVIEASYLIDLSGGPEAVAGKAHPSVRRDLRKARRQPLTFREAGEDDIPRFFELMRATCERQGVRPNPESAEALRRLWRLFAPGQGVRLFLVEESGRAIAGHLCLFFGGRSILWKRGWDGSREGWHPSKLLVAEILEWSARAGYRWADFCGFERKAAERILAGVPPMEANLNSRDLFHARFGGKPQLLPRARLLIPNGALRWAYRVAGRLVARR